MLPPSAAAAATTMSDADRYCFTMRDPDRVRPATSDPDRYCLASISETHGLLSLDTVQGGPKTSQRMAQRTPEEADIIESCMCLAFR